MIRQNGPSGILFLRKGRFKIEEKDFGKIVSVLREFLMPPATAAAQSGDFSQRWSASGPWRRG